MEELARRIEEAAADPGRLGDPKVAAVVEEVVRLLDGGEVRAADPPLEEGGPWRVNAWVKRAVLLYFRLRRTEVTEVGPFQYHDRIPLKAGFREAGVRVVPPAVVRYGAFLGRGVVLMPSYVNIGAYVGEETMVDTWATVGSCAQVGRRVHLSGGVGIGGVLEPPQARPTIVEDGAFVGSRCVLVEGVVVGREAVLAAGCVVTGTSRVIDVTDPSGPREYRGFIPPRSVAIPGSVPRRFPAGEFHVPCVLVIGRRKESTDLKTSLNDVLREFALEV